MQKIRIASKVDLERLIDRETKRALTSCKGITQRDIIKRLKFHFHNIALESYWQHGSTITLCNQMDIINQYFSKIGLRE